MQDSQSPAANPTNITAQPSPGIAADDHILRSTLNEAIRERRPSRLYAVVIGIDNYSSLNKLAGAVNDAKAMAEFLESHLNVPADRIRLLLDASRKEIIDAFKQLSEEDKIQRDDPILIYYAGHGAQLKAPHGWEAGGPGRKIQAICPRDYQKGSVPAIPDRTIGVFLDVIGEKKGNNITVIFDCCYSASGTRMEIPTAQDVRGVVLDDVLSLDLDQPEELSPLIGRSSQVATRSGVRGLGSHVLVAACKEEETAKEDNGRGRFTVALLELFKQGGRMETLTYTDILKDIKPILGQNPQVEGIHRDRIIFNAKAAPHRSLYSVHFNAGDRTFIVDAGSLHGVTMGSEFTVYKDHDSFLRSTVWGVLRVSGVKLTSSVLSGFNETSGIDLVKGVALLSSGGANQALAITTSYDPRLLPEFHQAIQLWERQGIISVVDETTAVVRLRLENGRLVFDILDPAVKASGLDQVYYSVGLTDMEHVASILSAGRDFFRWYLMRGPHHPIVDALKVEFMELGESQDKFNDTGYPILSPKGESLLRNGTIDLYVPSVAKPYGIKLTNNSEWDLFPAVFYFDHSDWSIVEYYRPGTAGQFVPEVPLRKKGGTLTIGYGAGSHEAVSFELIGEKQGEKQNFDVGHLKLFFTTEPADLRHIQQESPFTGTRGTFKFKQVLNTWVTLQYPIIQRRA